MSNFKEEPVTILVDQHDLKAAIENPTWYTMRDEGWRIKSVWLIALIDEIVATGKYPYNIDVQRAAEQRLGLPPSPDCGNPISRLVYLAQCYRHSDRLIANGFAPFTQAMIEEAHARKADILCSGGTLLHVREIDGKLFAMKPKKRKYAVRPDMNTPAKIVAKTKKVKA